MVVDRGSEKRSVRVPEANRRQDLKALLVEPDVFHAPTIEDAVDH
jgi:hypothetical protein